MIKYCPTCNRSSAENRFIGEFCEFCVIDKVKRKIPNQATITQCKRCERINGKFGHVKLKMDSLGNAITSELCGSKCKLKVRGFDGEMATVQFAYPIDDENLILFDKEIKIKIVNQICQDCYRKSSGYYEALVQLRGDKTLVATMAKRIEHFLTVRGAFITKTEPMDGGIDLYINDKVMTNKFFLVNKINPKKAYTLYGIKKAKKLYRNTYSLKL